MAGVFPLPSPLHDGFGLSAAGVFAPLFGAFALARALDRRWAVVTLLVAFVAVIVLFLIFNGLGGIATTANVGWWIRLAAVPAFGSTALIAWRAMNAPAVTGRIEGR